MPRTAMQQAQEAATALREQFARHHIQLSVTIDLASTIAGSPAVRIDPTGEEPILAGVQRLTRVLALAPAA